MHHADLMTLAVLLDSLAFEEMIFFPGAYLYKMGERRTEQ